ncbi:Regulatory protein, LuxR:Tetratricopeptide TPR_4 [Alloalcanivorax xenomutans]|jgi:LuxR family transcriptional regulator, maltose regulon positive regulatory protein|uniref:LuxR C-terminal-related transcriptional regulator n=1 Tax=Alloalcanivorax xenomutans TaxID=1094342 RepID=UPI0006D5C8B4|nr:LuxR C-terminal-related transcriptional regulator [Alloalcanivorax xenomutans]KYZ85536.1 helix-turn-helix transcriptional regulator [Alcanivorax sp. KX64203]PHS72543.1 MAG: LuxR family transcriptional regulator [Alcanivorax sp.]CUR47962.1 Regulatory protein, LuxR:Tetratricopeptide TPR_4 [Alloalcanivorax xenomutans]
MKTSSYLLSTRTLLNSKLSPPTSHSSQVTRTRIRDSVVGASAAKLVLFQAPAGFGKSTLMAQCLERFESEGVATAWLTLDDADNDIQRFLSCVEAAISSMMELPQESERGLHSSKSPGDTALELVTSLAAEHAAFALFLDDFERIHEPTVLGLVREIIDHLPHNCRLVIGSRSMPELGLGRLRARGRLLEIDSELMRFSKEETHQFLNGCRQLSLSLDDLGHIHDKTEGWVAALWLASLALEHHPAPAEFIASFSGENRAVAHYLAEDVLSQQPPRVRNFLLRTSILRYMSVPLCNALLPDTDSESLINLLNEANIFLVPIEGQERLYRYHSLFADFLRAQLEQHLPQEVPYLHRAASHWFEDQHRPVPAIDHALEGKDYRRALELLSVHGEELLAQGRMRLLARWFETIPAERLEGYPLLQAIHVWALCFTASPRKAMDLLQRTGLENSRDPQIRPHVLALRPSILAIMDDFEEAYRIGREALKQLPNGDPFADTALVNTVANAYSVMGEYQEARQLLDGARDVQGVYESAFNAMYSESVEGIIDLQEGRQRQAAARFRLAVGMTRARGAFSFSGTTGNAWAGVLHASAVYESNDLPQAARLLNVYVPLVRDIGLPDHMILGDVMLSRIAFHEGDLDKAFQILASLELTGHRRQQPRVVATARLERAHLMLLQGDEEASLAELDRADDPQVWDRVKGLRLLANDLETAQIGRLRWESLVGDAGSAVEKLREAIAEAVHDSRHRRACKLRLFLAVALQRKGQLRGALEEMEKVLKEACREGYFRLILDEGPRVGALVVHLQSDTLERKQDRREPLFAEYLQQLLQGFGPTVFNAYPPVEDAQALLLPEPLTRKEIRVLKLLAEGHSNSAMAEKLFVSDSTIRTHLRNINAKLNASNRTEAVAIARKAGVV